MSVPIYGRRCPTGTGECAGELPVARTQSALIFDVAIHIQWWDMGEYYIISAVDPRSLQCTFVLIGGDETLIDQSGRKDRRRYFSLILGLLYVIFEVPYLTIIEFYQIPPIVPNFIQIPENWYLSV